MVKIRQRTCFLIVTVLIIVPCFVILMIMGPELSTEQSLTQRLAECHMRLQYLESMYRARQEDVAVLSQYLGQLQAASNATTTLTTLSGSSSSTSNSISYSISNLTASFGPAANLLDSLSPEARQLLKNASHAQRVAQRYMPTTAIRMPNAYHFLPHLLDDQNSLRPAYLHSKGRSDVSIVLGVPTVKREKQSYLLGTLQNLIENMNDEEQNETLIVVYIGESDYETVQVIAKQIEISFEAQLDNGLIDIIAPAPSYYPNFDRLRITLNDPLERVKWRSKQNLDFAYLMAYAQAKGTFYVQLEDDILTKRQFITTMKKFALIKGALTKIDQPSWFILDFCQLGFIGKMFKSAELPYLITFFQMFYNDQPVDWLLTYFIASKVCRTDKDQKHCNQEKSKYWIHFRKSLFQHIGTSSSLKGKVQKLKDKQFGSKVPTYYAHTHNPPAIVESNIAPYKNYILKRAYRGETYFWGLLPQPGDLVRFIFDKPILLQRYLLRSGNSEHPSDRFYNTTVEILPIADVLNENTTAAAVTATSIWNNYNITNDGYIIISSFDALGLAEGTIDAKIGAIKELRLHVHSDSENWALLSEIDFQEVGANPQANAAKAKFANTNS